MMNYQCLNLGVNARQTIVRLSSHLGRPIAMTANIHAVLPIFVDVIALAASVNYHNPFQICPVNVKIVLTQHGDNPPYHVRGVCMSALTCVVDCLPIMEQLIQGAQLASIHLHGK